MNKSIAIITGATGGLGQKFTEYLTREKIDGKTISTESSYGNMG